MKRKKRENQNNNLRVAFVFFVFVSLLIFFGVAVKAFLMVVNGKFDGRHSMTLLIYSDKSDQGKYKGELFSFSPDASSISKTLITGKKSVSRAGEDLAVPVDGKIEASKIDNFKESIDIESMLGNAILNYREVSTDLTLIDLIRLWYFSKSIPKNSISTEDIFLNNPEQILIPDFFVDHTMLKEKVSIQIVNGTGISGFGNRLAKLITNIGGNVVEVSNSDSPLFSSQILFYGHKTYTVERLSRILNFNAKKIEELGISDIIIKLGKDSEKSKVF